MGRKEWYQTNNYIYIFIDIVQYFILLQYENSQEPNTQSDT